MKEPSEFSKRLINWYLDSRRQLPWRQNKDPYLIWVSEIILQQTRLNQGLDYYLRFVSRFPDIHFLADASEQEVLKIWEGLGYYSRARNMHETARFLVERNHGKLPETFEELIKLKGIGKYTAAAIASIAFDESVAVVDGNVLRFISRFFGIAGPIDKTQTVSEITRIVNNHIRYSSPGEFNQAMMEFGALQCVPANPDCETCCFSKDCVALKTGKVSEIPRKATKPKVSERFLNYLVVFCKHDDRTCVLLKRRGSGDIWKHLYDFPLVETKKLLGVKQLARHEEFRTLFDGLDPEIGVYQRNYRHLLTHRIIHARFFKVIIGCKSLILPDGFVCTDEIIRYPLPKLISNFLVDHGLVNNKLRIL